MRVAAIILAGFTVAQAEPNTLTLACAGMVTHPFLEYGKPQPISMTIAVSFATGTVQGFLYPAKIIDANDLTVEFEGSDNGLLAMSIRGSIDHVTGDVIATYTSRMAESYKLIVRADYALKCKPAQRMF